MHSFTRKLLIVLAIIGLIIVGLHFIWEKNKFAIVKHKISELFLAKTDSLYSIQYDSLFFDEKAGNAYLKNIHIIPDTLRVKRGLHNLPYAVLDINIRSLDIRGINTNDAVKGQQIIGNNIVIDHPEITAYVLRKIRRETKIDAEAKNIYHEIFHKLTLVQVNDVNVKNAQIHVINFASHERQYELKNANLQLHNVRIDSLHKDDSTRILFCKEALFNIDEFSSFNKNRVEFSIYDINYNGGGRRLMFSKVLVNR